MIFISRNIRLEDYEICWEFTRSPGPGGQNVNRLETTARLRFDAANSPALPEPVRQRLLHRRDHRITEAGEIVITARKFRSQARNREEALERFVELVRSALVAPKKRRPTKPSKAAKERRISNKKHRSSIKKNRGRPAID